MDKLKRVLSGNDQTPDEEAGIMPYLNEASTLSWSTRIKGFVICFVLGVLLSILGSVMLFLHLGLTRFAVLYTFGNVLSMASTCFLMGPFKQIRKMFAETRWIATTVVIVSFALTLVSAIVLHKAGLALLCIIVQSLAMTWYSLSYIPWARDAVKKTITTIVV